MLVAFVLSSVPLTLFLFGSVVVLNSYRVTETIEGIPGLILAGLFVTMLLGTHGAHTLVRDVADRATGALDDETTRTRSREATDSHEGRSGMDRDDTVPATDDPGDPETHLRRRYADGDLSDEEFERRLETLQRSKTGSGEPDRVFE